jgi:hypothetical protein
VFRQRIDEETMSDKRTLLVYHVQDTHGNVEFDVAHERYDDIFIAVKDTDLQYNLTYDGEAKDLKAWCDHHGLEYKTSEIPYQVPNPFEST